MATTNILPNLNGYALIKTTEQAVAKANCIYDTITNFGEDADTSYVAIFPCMFQVSKVPAGTIMSVQAKIHPDADWLEIWQGTNDQFFMQTYQMPYNFMRTVRLSGSGNVKVFYAAIPTDTMG